MFALGAEGEVGEGVGVQGLGCSWSEPGMAVFGPSTLELGEGGLCHAGFLEGIGVVCLDDRSLLLL